MNAVRESVPLTLDGLAMHISVLHRAGTKPACIFLHGFGSTKEDYADILLMEEYSGYGYLAFDYPGCGSSEIDHFDELDIPFLVQLTKSLLEHFEIDAFHLIGHSMGGLTALLLAHEFGPRVLSFTNIEGNLAPEDCFFSRSVLNNGTQSPRAFLSKLADALINQNQFGYAVYGAGLKAKVHENAVEPYFRSIVALSDGMDLLGIFGDLQAKRQFIYGEQNRHLSYLPTLRTSRCQLVEIATSSHFPMYSNATALFQSICKFVNCTDTQAFMDHTDISALRVE